MRSPRVAAAVAATALMASGAVLAAGAANASAVTVGNWKMDEKGGSVMKDFSGHGNAGRIGPNTGVIVHQPGVTAFGYVFTGHGAVVVPPDPSLDPGNSRIAWSIYVKVKSSTAAGKEFNLLQKGQVDSVGGQYKLEMNSGVPRCYVRENASQPGGGNYAWVTAARPDGSAVSVADNRWHKLTCNLGPEKLGVVVDGVRRGAVAADFVGAINPTKAPLTVGGKFPCPPSNCDYYQGSLDDARVTIG